MQEGDTNDSLKEKTTKGFLWTTVEQASYQGIHFIIGLILARLLSPSDYGMIGMLSFFISISGTFVESGFSQALIRMKERTEVDYSTVFYFNIVVSVIVYLILFFCAPYIASFYERPQLNLLTKIIGLTIIINAFSIVQIAQFTVEVNFKTIAKVNIIASIVSGVTGVVFAYSGFGYWALAFSQIAKALVQCVLLWFISNWRPIIAFSVHSFKNMFSFGSKLLLSGLINTVFKNVYPLIIGKVYSADILGYYSRANGYANLSATITNNVVAKVTYPVLCKVQNDDVLLVKTYRKLLRLSAFVIFPCMLGLAALARPLIICLITEKWAPSILLLQILCLSTMWYPIHALNLNLLTVKGRSDWFLQLEIIKKILTVIVLVITIPFGITALCIGTVISSLVALGINTYYTARLLDYGFGKQMKDLWPSLLCSFFMAALIVFVNSFVNNGWLQIVLGIIVGVVFYFGLAIIVNADDMKILKNQLFTLFNNGRSKQ